MTEEKITWSLLCDLEPRLIHLLAKVRGIEDDKRKPSFCANAIWYGWNGRESLRGRVDQLVGWHAIGSDPRLKTPQAYDLAYEKLYNLLPPCRNCNCL